MRLYIAEKPTLAKAIADGIGKNERTPSYIQCANGDRVTWCFGHMMKQAPPDAYGEQFKTWRLSSLPVIPVEWLTIPVQPLPNPLEKESIAKENQLRKSSYAHFKAIVELIKDKEVTEIVNAGDPDREGQLIVDEILDHLNVRKKVLRIWLNAYDPDSIRKAIASLEDNSLQKFKGLKHSAVARGRADWLVGMNMTRAITSIAQSKSGDRTVWTIGRVQTPVLRLVHERNEEIANFRPKDFYVPIVTVVTGKNLSVDLEWNEREIPGITDEEKRILSRADAERIIQNAKGKSFPVEVKKETKMVNPPLPWALSTLQVFAGKEFGMSPKAVLDTVQSLYDNGYVSYPRTDCEYLPESIHQDASKILPLLTGAFPVNKSLIDPSRKSKAFNDSRLSAHYAITPTAKVPSLSSLSPGERDIYEAISKVYMAQFAPPLSLSETRIGLKNSPDSFSVSGKIIGDRGWTEIWSHGGPKNDKVLPAIENGESVKVSDGTVRASKTTPPKPFTESGIIDVMKSVHKYVTDKEAKSILKESDGIGTEATRAEIVNELILRGLLEKDSGKSKDPALLVTDKGRTLLKSVPQEVSNPVLTATWERSLAEIAQSGKVPDPFVEEVSQKVSKWITDLKGSFGTMDMGRPGQASSGVECIDCGKVLLKRSGNFGPFWAHDMNDESSCQKLFPDDNGKPGKPKEPKKSEGIGPPCTSCKTKANVQIYRTTTGNNYYECPDCKTRYWIANGGELGSAWKKMASSSSSKKAYSGRK